MELGSYALFISCFVIFITTAFSSEKYRCPPAATTRGDDTYHTFHGKCYQFIHREVNWAEARDDCRNKGGRLLEIRDDKTQRWIKYVLTELHPMNGWDKNGMWLGGHDRHTEGRYEWDSDGTLIGNGYSAWADGEPSGGGDCVTFRISDGGKWIVKPCHTIVFVEYEYFYTCQYELLPPTTTTTTTTTFTPRTSTVAGVTTGETESTTTQSEGNVNATVLSSTISTTESSKEGNSSIIITLPTGRTHSTTTSHSSGEGGETGRQTAVNDDTLSEGALIGLIVVSTILFLVIVIFILCFIVVRRRKSKNKPIGFVNKMYVVFKKRPTRFTRPTTSDNAAARQDNIINENATGDNTCSKLEFENPYDQIPADMIGEGPCGYSTCEFDTNHYDKSLDSPYDEPKAMKPYDTPKERNLGQDNVDERLPSDEPQKAATNYLTPSTADDCDAIKDPPSRKTSATTEGDNPEVATLETPIRAKSNDYSSMNFQQNDNNT